MHGPGKPLLEFLAIIFGTAAAGFLSDTAIQEGRELADVAHRFWVASAICVAIAVAGTDLKADSNLHASVSVTDVAGNTGTASRDHAYTVDLAAQATDDTDRVTEDSHPGTSGNVLANDEHGAVVKTAKPPQQ